MRVGIYVRVSTPDKGQDPELQLEPLRNFARVRGWDVQEYLDLGESGAKDRRPGLDRLMEDARKRRIDGVLVWKFDRFARSLRSLLVMLEELRVLGVQFVSYTENLDFSTPAGRAMVSLIGAFAEFERDLIRERVRAGLQNARNKGKRIGRRPLIDMARLRTVAHMRGSGNVGPPNCAGRRRIEEPCPQNPPKFAVGTPCGSRAGGKGIDCPQKR